LNTCALHRTVSQPLARKGLFFALAGAMCGDAMRLAAAPDAARIQTRSRTAKSTRLTAGSLRQLRGRDTFM
jgi:hypothetical protein